MVARSYLGSAVECHLRKVGFESKQVVNCHYCSMLPTQHSSLHPTIPETQIWECGVHIVLKSLTGVSRAWSLNPTTFPASQPRSNLPPPALLWRIWWRRRQWWNSSNPWGQGRWHLPPMSWVFPKNRGTPKSWILIGVSIINHPFWGVSPSFWKHPCIDWLLLPLANGAMICFGTAANAK